jgi:hypothetical protein
MSAKNKTYLYLQDGRQEGPYFESQILSMASSGIIHADAQIQCVEDNTNGPLEDFLASIQKTLSPGVVVTDVSIPFGSMVVLLLKWFFAAFPVAIIFAVLVFIFRS